MRDREGAARHFQQIEQDDSRAKFPRTAGAQSHPPIRMGEGGDTPRGSVCLERARHAISVLTILTLPQICPPPEKPTQMDQSGPQMRHIVPWSRRRATDLPPDAKLRKVQQNMHRLVQRIGAATPNVPYQTLMPQPSTRVPYTTHVHRCTTLLPGRHSSILSSNEWHGDMHSKMVMGR